jgi:hypothetical protein
VRGQVIGILVGSSDWELVVAIKEGRRFGQLEKRWEWEVRKGEESID